MAGTDKSRERGGAPIAGAPAIILVNPQLAENIGTSARAMLNCGLTDLRLVSPRDPFPHPKATAAASGADLVLQRARVFETTAQAVADLTRVYACTARGRDMNKRIVTPRHAGGELYELGSSGETCGILFGPEKSGLVNNDLALADTVVMAPLNPAYRSLNLAQAVLLVSYEWFQSAQGSDPDRLIKGGAKAATKEELLHFFEHLERELDESNFLYPPEKRPTMVVNIRNMFQRAHLMDQEVRTLRGIITALTNRRDRKG